jgi:hypothetical protein
MVLPLVWMPCMFDAGQQIHHVGGMVQRDPVELHVLARREVAVARLQARCREVADAILRGLRLGQQRSVGPVVVAGDLRQHAHLRAGQLAVGHGDAQHRRVALHIPAVLQAQRAKLIVAELAGLPAFQLVAVLSGAELDELGVEVGVLVHDSSVRRETQSRTSLVPA